MVRVTGDTLAFSPPLIIEETHIEQLLESVRRVLRSLH
jgi:beta-alanine--pyruvate transaminase